MAAAACLIALASGPSCESRSRGQPGAEPHASASPVVSADPPAVGRAKLKVGDEVEVCWRRTKADALFSKNEAPYRCSARVRAVPAPWGAGEGGIHGRMLTKALRDASPELGGDKAWLRAVELNRDPRAPGSGIGLDDSESSYFNEYVGVDANGRARVHIEVETR